MAKKRHRAEQIIAKLREAEVELAKGQVTMGQPVPLYGILGRLGSRGVTCASRWPGDVALRGKEDESCHGEAGENGDGDLDPTVGSVALDFAGAGVDDDLV